MLVTEKSTSADGSPPQLQEMTPPVPGTKCTCLLRIAQFKTMTVRTAAGAAIVPAAIPATHDSASRFSKSIA